MMKKEKKNESQEHISQVIISLIFLTVFYQVHYFGGQFNPREIFELIEIC